MKSCAPNYVKSVAGAIMKSASKKRGSAPQKSTKPQSLTLKG